MPVQIIVARQLIAYARLRADLVRQRRDDQWGASAIEWAIISAIVVAAAVLIGGAIRSAVSGQKDDMCSEEGIEC
jgi:Flp pilus assembly pilin Flp